MSDADWESQSDYRIAKPFPFELRQHCGIYFEEKLYSQALGLLLNILTCGTASFSPAFVPSPQHLAIAATFLVHPSTTTRAKTTEEHEAASAALQLLRLTNTLVGPIQAKFDVAFAFTHFDSSRHGGRRREEGRLSSVMRDDDTAPLNLDLAQSSSLWVRAEDFWHAVGWAFNCSVLHPKRWERWQMWLEFMCQAMEDDWKERERRFGDPVDSSQPATPGKRRERILKQSIIVKYLTTGNMTYGQNRRTLRAIFADGSPTSVNEFREVFKNELKELKGGEDEKFKKREVDVNIDEDQYGDYMAKDEDESDELDPGRAHPKRAKRGTNPSKLALGATGNDISQLPDSMYSKGGVAYLGDSRSIALRRRLLQLLSTVSQELPKAFLPLDELYHLFVENIRHLPLPVFQAFTTPTLDITDAALCSLCEILLYRLRESNAPASDKPLLDQEKLETCFLPYAANTASVVDNTKVSICLECLVILLAGRGLLKNTSEFREAVREGILMRYDRAQVEVRRSQNSKKMEDIDRCWLIESGDRLMYLIEDILPKEQDAEKPS